MRQTIERVLSIINKTHDSIVFDEDMHRYFVDGVERPSVSEIMKPVSCLVYGNVISKSAKQAMKRGSDVHKAIELYDEVGLLPDMYEPYFDAYMKWRDQAVGLEPICNEKRVMHSAYCGTIDKLMYEEKFDRFYLVDIKTGDVAHPELWQVQMELYRKALRYMSVDITGWLVVQLKSDESFEVFGSYDEEARITDALLDIHAWRERTGL